MKLYVSTDGGYREFIVEPDGDRWRIQDGNRTVQVDLRPLDERRYSLLIDHRSVIAELIDTGERLRFRFNGQEHVLAVRDERQRMAAEMFGAREHGAGMGEIRAPMPGLILRIEVQPGDAVKPGQPLLVMEAMKMENEIRAVSEGIVEKIAVQPQQPVEKDDLLIQLKV